MSTRRKRNRGNPSAPSGPEPQRRAGRSRPRSSGEESTSNPRLLVYALIGVSIFLFAYLHLYAMPQLTYFAGGFSMPDAQIVGFDSAYIQRLRNVMDDSGLGQLSFLHRTAGILFPLACFLAAWAVAGLLMRRGVFRWCVVALAGIFAVIDVTKSFMIDRILTMEPLDDGLVATASSLTVISWILMVAVGAVVVGTAVVRIMRGSLERGAGTDGDR